MSVPPAAARPRRVLIVGCGDVGTALGLELAAAGFEVFGARRHPGGLPRPIRPVALDVTEPRCFDTLPRDLHQVFYTASASGRSDPAGYRAVYVDGPRHLVAHLTGRGESPRVAVLASSTSVWGAITDGSTVDEDTPPAPADFRGEAIVAGERAFAAAPWPTVALRLGGIYGPGRTWLVEGVRAGRIGLSTDGRSPFTNRIHRDDAARALAWIGGLAAPAACYCGVDRESARRDDVVRWLAARLGVTPATGAATDPRGGSSRGGDKCVSSARLAATGFRFRYPTFREGYTAVLEDTR